MNPQNAARYGREGNGPVVEAILSAGFRPYRVGPDGRPIVETEDLRRVTGDYFCQRS